MKDLSKLINRTAEALGKVCRGLVEGLVPAYRPEPMPVRVRVDDVAVQRRRIR